MDAPPTDIASEPETGHLSAQLLIENVAITDQRAQMDPEIRSYLDGLAEDARQMIDALRTIVWNAAPNAVETIKWNAPSFAIDGQDCITLGLDRRGGARLVLHRGAKQREIVDLTALDHDGIAQWPSLDRGVVMFRDLEEARKREIAVTALCSRWVEATA